MWNLLDPYCFWSCVTWVLQKSRVAKGSKKMNKLKGQPFIVQYIIFTWNVLTINTSHVNITYMCCINSGVHIRIVLVFLAMGPEHHRRSWKKSKAQFPLSVLVIIFLIFTLSNFDDRCEYSILPFNHHCQ